MVPVATLLLRFVLSKTLKAILRVVFPPAVGLSETESNRAP